MAHPLRLNPGGSFELSGAVLQNLHQTCAETASHLQLMTEIMDGDCIWIVGDRF